MSQNDLVLSHSAQVLIPVDYWRVFCGICSKAFTESISNLSLIHVLKLWSQHTMGQKNKKFRCKHWVACSFIRSLARTFHLLSCSALLPLHARYAELISLLTCSATHSRAFGKVSDLCWVIRLFWTIVGEREKEYWFLLRKSFFIVNHRALVPKTQLVSK